MQIVAAIARFRAGGYDERIGFTVYDTLRYRQALAPLVEEEVACSSIASSARSRSTGRRDHRSGAAPLRELVGAMHAKLLFSALRRQRGGTRGGASERNGAGA